MRVLGILAAWGVLAVLSTMCFALGGSIGYRRGVRDAVAQLRDRRSGKTGCRPLPANHLRRRTSGRSRPGARARRARWQSGRPAARPAHPAQRSQWTTAAAAGVAVVLLLGIPGTAIGATTAQPGESLWKVKLGLERVRLALATGPERDAEVHMDLASARLTELGGLVGKDVPAAVVSDVSSDLGSHAIAASDVLPAVKTPAVRDQLQRRIEDVTTKQVVVMDTLLGLDCRDGDGTDCVALNETRDETRDLRDAADEPVALAVPVESEVAVATPAPTSEAQDSDAASAPAGAQNTEPDASGQTAAAAEGQATAAASEPTSPASAAVSVSPSASGTAGESPSATPRPDPSASPTRPVSGSPATETADPVSTSGPSENTAGGLRAAEEQAEADAGTD